MEQYRYKLSYISELLTSWTNDNDSFDSFVSSRGDIIEAYTGGTLEAIAKSNSFNLANTHTYRIIVDITLYNGDLPTSLNILTDDGYYELSSTLTAGVNTFDYVAAEDFADSDITLISDNLYSIWGAECSIKKITESLTLTNLPAGWEDKSISFIRHEFYKSVMRSMGLNLRFVFEGKDLIELAYSEAGISAIIDIEIQEYDPSDDTYATYYTGILDLSNLKITRDFAECPILDNMVLSKFNARDEMELSLNELVTLDDDVITEFTNGLTKDATIKGMEIREQALYNGSGVDFTDYLGSGKPVISNQYDINDIGDDATVIPATNVIYTNNSGGNVRMYYEITVTIKLLVTFTDVTNGQFDFKTQLFDGVNTIDLFSFSEINITEDQTFEYDDTQTLTSTITVAYGSEFELYSFFDFDDTTASVEVLATFKDITIDLQKVTLAFADTIEEVILPHEALTRLLQRTVGGTIALNAPVIGRTDSEPNTYGSDGDFGFASMASGFMIRSFPLTSKPSITSVRKMFKSLSALNPIGLWYDAVNDEWDLLSLDNFYRNDNIITLGEVADFERTIDEKYYHNAIKGGYVTKLEYEKINGNQNFNTLTEYSNTLSNIKNTIDLASHYRADDYGIELVRKSQYISTSNTDTKYDKDILAVWIAMYLLLSPNFSIFEEGQSLARW